MATEPIGKLLRQRSEVDVTGLVPAQSGFAHHCHDRGGLYACGDWLVNIRWPVPECQWASQKSKKTLASNPLRKLWPRPGNSTY